MLSSTSGATIRGGRSPLPAFVVRSTIRLIVLGAALCCVSCTSYYAVEATLPNSVPETREALVTAVGNIADLSVIEDGVPPSDSATMRYLGLQGVATTSGRPVTSTPKFAIRLYPSGTQSSMSVTSVGGDQYAKMVIVATEQELQRRTLVTTDSGASTTAVGALAFKSGWFHQTLNLITPAAGMVYVQKDNPYIPPHAIIEDAGALMIDALGLYLISRNLGQFINSVRYFLAPNSGVKVDRNGQYKFVIGLVLSTLLRYQYGTQGFLQIQQYNALADAPYTLNSGFIDPHIDQIGITISFP